MIISDRWNESANIWEIELSGEVDIYNAPELKEKLLELIDKRPCNLEINCRNLKYIDSTGLGVLISALRRVKEYNGEIYIKQIAPYIYKIFTITGLDKVFKIEIQE